MQEIINSSLSGQVERVSWYEIKEQVHLVNPELAGIIEELPVKNCQSACKNDPV